MGETINQAITRIGDIKHYCWWKMYFKLTAICGKFPLEIHNTIQMVNDAGG